MGLTNGIIKVAPMVAEANTTIPIMMANLNLGFLFIIILPHMIFYGIMPTCDFGLVFR